MSAVVCCQASGAAALIMGAEGSLHTQHPQTGGGRNAPQRLCESTWCRKNQGGAALSCIFVSISVVFWAKLNLFTHFASCFVLFCVLYRLFSLCSCVTSPVSLLFCTCFLCFAIFRDSPELLCNKFFLHLFVDAVHSRSKPTAFRWGYGSGGMTRTILLLFPQRLWQELSRAPLSQLWKGEKYLKTPDEFTLLHRKDDQQQSRKTRLSLPPPEATQRAPDLTPLTWPRY